MLILQNYYVIFESDFWVYLNVISYLQMRISYSVDGIIPTNSTKRTFCINQYTNLTICDCNFQHWVVYYFPVKKRQLFPTFVCGSLLDQWSPTYIAHTYVPIRNCIYWSEYCALEWLVTALSSGQMKYQIELLLKKSLISNWWMTEE